MFQFPKGGGKPVAKKKKGGIAGAIQGILDKRRPTLEGKVPGAPPAPAPSRGRAAADALATAMSNRPQRKDTRDVQSIVNDPAGTSGDEAPTRKKKFVNRYGGGT
jgi:hypothetical protein